MADILPMQRSRSAAAAGKPGAGHGQPIGAGRAILEASHDEERDGLRSDVAQSTARTKRRQLEPAGARPGAR